MKYKQLLINNRWIYTVALILLLAVGGIIIWQSNRNISQNSSGAKPSLISKPQLNNLATTSSDIDRSHLADGVTPPTNKWFSGFALQAEPKPGYNYPNSFKPTDSGFEFSLPKVQAQSDIITGPHAPDVVVDFAAASSYKITSYDELTVKLTYYNQAGQALATVSLASGLPYVYITAQQDSQLKFSGQATSHDNWTEITSNQQSYGLNVGSSDNQFSLASGDSASFFSAPGPDQIATVLAHADAVVESGTVSYERNNNTFTTRLDYQTTNDQPVLFGRLPHQQQGSNSQVTYRSILGDINTEVGHSFSFDSAAITTTSRLDLSNISADEHNLLVDQLRKDIAKFETKPDTYFGGKQLYPMAQLLMIADQLDQTKLADSAQNKLKHELETWLTPGKNQPKSLLYDPDMQGIVGNEASFGSDKEFNDHHFHYGYFIYAAAVLSQYDGQFLNQYKDTVNLLVADIANYNTNQALPLRRAFDPYVGHSWASGTAPFADGNNQESTSEAINAWVGVSLWAEQVNNQDLALEADWMLSQEYTTTEKYWLRQGTSAPDYLADYDKPLVSIVWGAKRDYSTFFSDKANAKLAIQLLPLSPTIHQLGRQLPNDLFTGTNIHQPYGDYILMARPDATLKQALNLPDKAIDDGNSRTYIYAYLLAK